MKKCVVVFVYLHFNDGLKYMSFTPTCHFDGWQNHVVLSSFTPDCPKKMSRWTMPSSSATAPIRNGGWRFIAMASRLLQKKRGVGSQKTHLVGGASHLRFEYKQIRTGKKGEFPMNIRKVQDWNEPGWGGPQLPQEPCTH